MTLSSIESVFYFIKNDGRQLPYEVSSIRSAFLYCFSLFALCPGMPNVLDIVILFHHVEHTVNFK